MYVIKISVYGEWGTTYVIPKPTEQDAKETAFNAAKKQFSCVLPDTLEGFEKGDGCYMEVLSDDTASATLISNKSIRTLEKRRLQQ